MSVSRSGPTTGPRRPVLGALLLVWWLLAPSMPAAGQEEQDARALYNAGLVDAAIERAEAELEETGTTEAALVLARARLERFRRLEVPIDLAVARRLLDGIDASTLSPREAVDWEIGVATSLFFDDRPGPAAVIFERLLDDPLLVAGERDRILDWWATSLDRIGREMTQADRSRNYARMLQRLDAELVADPASPSALYWVVVAARGVGDPERAWDLAVASWVRASLTGPAREKLRTDLDRLVLQGVIPDVAVARTGEDPDQALTVRAMATLAAEWEELKTFWAGSKTSPAPLPPDSPNNQCGGP